MNREDVAMDLTFENLDILRREVQAAKLLLSECDEIFIEEGISNIELRGYLSGKLSADEVIELLDPPAEQRNQCDGCQAGIPLVDGAHRMGRPGGYPDLMSCQKERYKHPEQAEGAQGELHPDLKRVYDVIGLHYSHPVSILIANFENTKRFAELLHAVEREFFMVPGEPSDEPEDEGCEPDDVCLMSCWGSTQEQYIEQFRDALAVIQARAALAQPSPAPELERPEVGDE